jgi:WD40 repeat protein
MTALGDAGGFAAQFADNGRRLVVADTDGACRVWNFAASPAVILPSTKWLVRDLAATRIGDTCLLASIQADGELRLRARSAATGVAANAWTEKIAINVGGRARSLAMTADGLLIVVGLEDGRLLTIRAADGKVVQETHAHQQTINAVRMAQDGRTLVTAGVDRTARVWRRLADDAGWDARLSLRCDGEIVGATISADGAIIATTSRLASLRLWSATDGQLLHEVVTDKVPWKPVFTPDGNWLATGAWDRAIQFWNVRPIVSAGQGGPGAIRHALSLLGHTQLVSAEAFDDSGKFLASVSNDGTLRIWDVSGLALGHSSDPPVLDRRRCLITLDAGVGDAYAVTFLPAPAHGSGSVAVGYIDGTVRVWDLDAFDDYLRGHAEHQQRIRSNIRLNQ